MTDILAERFSALADTTDDSDWLDVRRRARSTRRGYVLAVAAAAAAVVVAAAIAASNRWIFTGNGGAGVLGTAQVQFQGKTWAVKSLISNGGRFFCLLLIPESASSPSLRFDLDNFVGRGCGASVLTVKGMPQQLIPPSAATGPAFGALNFNRGHGQIWFGDARPTIATIAITDSRGRVTRTQTVAPSNLKTAFRIWIVALPSTTGKTITGYDEHGKLVQSAPIYGLGAFNLH